MVADRPKKPKKTGEEVAAQRRQTVALDRETEEEERRLRALSRGRLGASSLLAGLGGDSGSTSGGSTPRSVPRGPRGPAPGRPGSPRTQRR